MTSSDRRALVAAALLAASCHGASSPHPTPPDESPPTPASATKLEVGWISREPRFRAPETLDGPGTDGWPAEGSAVHWIAHVINRHTSSVPDVPYIWSIDGSVASRGVVDLVPGDNEIVFPWTWTFERHQIDLAIMPPPEAHDNTDTDDHVTIDSDALSIAFYVDRTEYARLPDTSGGSFEHRMQQQIPYWNAVLANAVYPSTPNGALDRLRLDKVVIVENGTPIPDEDYFDTDLFWRFTAASSFFEGPYGRDQTIVLHEILHQRGLVDIYAYEVAHHYSPSDDDGRVDVVENGKAVVGTFLMPAIPDGRDIGGIFVFESPVDGVMGRSYYRGIASLTEVCANGLNLWHGRRSPVRRSPIGGGIVLGLKDVLPESYVNRLPSVTALTFTEGGRPVTGGAVDVFFDQNGHPYLDTYSADPQLTLSMNADGAVMLPGDGLSTQPPWRQPPKAQTLLFRVRTPAARAYVFVPVWNFNRQYFRDGGGPSQLEVPVKMIPY